MLNRESLKEAINLEHEFILNDCANELNATRLCEDLTPMQVKQELVVCATTLTWIENILDRENPELDHETKLQVIRGIINQYKSEENNG